MTSRRATLIATSALTLGAFLVLLAVAVHRPPTAGGSPLLGKAAPRLSGQTLDGRPFRMRPRRHALTVVNVWASWCGPCRRELPMIARLEQGWSGRRVDVVTVDTRDRATSARGLLRDVGAAGLVAVQDPSGRIAVSWGATGVPETFVVDGHGVVRGRWLGAVSETWLRDQVSRWAGS